MRRHDRLRVLAIAFLAAPAFAQQMSVQVDPSGYSPVVAASGTAVYVGWYDRRTTSPKHEIYFSRSLDGGATWPQGSVRINVGTAAGTTEAYGPAIAAAGDAVYAVWMEYRASATNGDVFFNRSLDRGATWLPAVVRLDTGSPPGASHSWIPRLAVAGQAVYVAWADQRHGTSNPSLYFNRSLDGGTTWLPTDVRLDTGVAAGAGGADLVTMVANGTAVHVAWADFRNGTSNADIHYNRSLDRGTTWLASDARVNVGRPVGAWLSTYPAIAADGSAVFVAWQDSLWYGSNADILCNRSLDAGVTWLPAAIRLDTATAPMTDDSSYARVHVSGSSALVVWQQAASLNGAYDILCNHSPDLGATWLPAPVRLDTGSAPGSSASWYPDLAAAAGSVYVTWTDSRGPGTGTSNIYYNRSLDSGATWLPTDVRLSFGTGYAANSNYYARIAAGGSSFHAVWERPAYYNPYSIWYAMASGYQPYGPGTAGTGAAVPVLSGSGWASIAGILLLDFTDGVGGAPGLVVLGAGPGSKVSVPLLGGTLLVQPSGPAQTVGIVLGGAPGLARAGSATYVVPVPNDAVFLGFQANFQGLFLDPGAASGVSMSNGLSTWIG